MKYSSQNLAASIPPCPSNTAKRPIPESKFGYVICASSILILQPYIDEHAQLYSL